MPLSTVGNLAAVMSPFGLRLKESMLNRKLSSILSALGYSIAIAPVVLGFGWAILYFGFYIGYGSYQTWGHQQFAANGVSQVEPASQMDRLFADCRHYITYGAKDIALFNSVAYFGGRYVLTMQVPVEIHSATSGSTIGEPRFYLDETSAITIAPDGQFRASFSRGMSFGTPEWQRVHDAKGDFGAIGFSVNPTPVANFNKFAAAERPSN